MTELIKTGQKLPTVIASKLQSSSVQGKPWNSMTPMSGRQSNGRNSSSVLGMNSPQTNTYGRIGSKKQDPSSLYGSPVQKLFNQNKESVEDMLVRKFRTKYIDKNPAFSQREISDLEKVSPRMAAPGANRYLSLKQKGIFDKLNQSAIRAHNTGG